MSKCTLKKLLMALMDCVYDIFKSYFRALVKKVYNYEIIQLIKSASKFSQNNLYSMALTDWVIVKILRTPFQRHKNMFAT